jgi:hypothetical protein
MLQLSDAPVKPLDKYHSPEYHAQNDAQNDRITEFVSLTRRQTPPSQTIFALVMQTHLPVVSRRQHEIHLSPPMAFTRLNQLSAHLSSTHSRGLLAGEVAIRTFLEASPSRPTLSLSSTPLSLGTWGAIQAFTQPSLIHFHQSYYPHHAPHPLPPSGTASSVSSPRAPNPSTSPTFPRTCSPSLFASPSSPMLGPVSPSQTCPSP